MEIKPDLLTIDGVANNPLSTDFENAFLLWMRLPCNPDKLNPEGIRVATGDIPYRDLRKNPVSKEVIQILEEQNLKKFYSEMEQRKTVAKTSLLIILSSALALAASAKIDASKIKENLETQKTMTRRTMLKTLLASVVTAGGIAGSNSIPTLISEKRANNMASTAASNTKKAFWSTIANITEPEEHTLTDGRTALMISRTTDAMEYLNKHHEMQKPLKASVIAGNAHINGASEMLGENSSNYRHEKLLTQMAIYKVTEPKSKTDYNCLEDAIVKESEFTSQSSQNAYRGAMHITRQELNQQKKTNPTYQ